MSLINKDSLPSFISPKSQLLLQKHSLRMEYSAEKGRGIFADRDFKAGEVVLQSKPYAFALHHHLSQDHCHQCFKKQSSVAELKRCGACKVAKYCSVNCQKTSWVLFHKQECSFWKEKMVQEYTKALPPTSVDEVNLLFRAMSRFFTSYATDSAFATTVNMEEEKDLEIPQFLDVALQVTTAKNAKKMDPQRWASNCTIAKIVCQRLAATLPTKLFSTSVVTSATTTTSSSSTTPSSTSTTSTPSPAFSTATPQPETTTKLSASRVFATQYLFSEKTEEIVLHLLCAMQCNDFGLSTPLALVRGLGIYPTAGLINHACIGNCCPSYDLETKQQTFRSVRDIKKGEEITHSFIDFARPFDLRKQHLSQNYGFACDCEFCADTPKNREMRAQLEDLTSVAYLSSNMEKVKHASRLYDEVMYHPSSSTFDSLLKLLTVYDIQKQFMNKYNISLLSTAGAFTPFLIEWMDTVDLVNSPERQEMSEWLAKNKDNSTVAQLLGQIASRKSTIQFAIELSNYILEVYNYIYPNPNPIVGLQYITNGDFCLMNGEPEKQQIAHEKAKKILKICYGTSDYFFRS